MKADDRNPDAIAVGSALRKMRKRIGLTIKDAAQELGVPKSNLTAHEFGRHTMSVTTLVRYLRCYRGTFTEIAAAMGCDDTAPWETCQNTQDNS